MLRICHISQAFSEKEKRNHVQHFILQVTQLTNQYIDASVFENMGQ